MNTSSVAGVSCADCYSVKDHNGANCINVVGDREVSCVCVVGVSCNDF